MNAPADAVVLHAVVKAAVNAALVDHATAMVADVAMLRKPALANVNLAVHQVATNLPGNHLSKQKILHPKVVHLIVMIVHNVLSNAMTAHNILKAQTANHGLLKAQAKSVHSHLTVPMHRNVHGFLRRNLENNAVRVQIVRLVLSAIAHNALKVAHLVTVPNVQHVASATVLLVQKVIAPMLRNAHGFLKQNSENNVAKVLVNQLLVLKKNGQKMLLKKRFPMGATATATKNLSAINLLSKKKVDLRKKADLAERRNSVVPNLSALNQMAETAHPAAHVQQPSSARY